MNRNYNKNSKLKKVALGITAAAVVFGSITAPIFHKVKESRYISNEIKAVQNGTKSSFEDRLTNSSSIEIKEVYLTWGKRYDLYVDNDMVAQVTGKDFKLWGDTFTLKTLDGKVLASEDENKRVLFKLNRSAVCYDENSNITGYLGEERFKDLFKWGYIFHFYDKDQKEIGYSEKIGRSCLARHKLYDVQKNVDYGIDRKMGIPFLTSYFTLSVDDLESVIPLEHAILLTCIEDAIADSQKTKRLSRKRKKKSKK